MIGLIIGAAVGAVAGGISALSSTNTQDKALQRQIQNEKIKALLAVNSLDQEFAIAKDEANKSADKSDAQQDLNEGFLSADINNELEILQANEEAQGLSNNTQAMSIGQSTGDSLSQMAASGTRNSSQAQAVEMQETVNNAQLEASEKQARANDDYSLYKLLNSLSENTADIQTARTDALDLRQSYEVGGNQYKTYQNNRNNTLINYYMDINELQTQRSQLLNKGNIALSTATSAFNGAASGAGFGNSIERTWKEL